MIIPRELPPFLRVLLVPAALVVIAPLGHADSNNVSVPPAFGAKLQAHSHLDFRITVQPNIALPANAAVALPMTLESTIGANLVGRVRRARHATTTQIVVVDGTHRYTVAEP